MKIILATSGSRGDVQPMIALCLALKHAGHDASLAGPPEKALWAARMGCPYYKIGRDVTAFINRMDDVLSPGPAIDFISHLRQEIHTQFRQLPQIIKNSDLVMGSSLVFALSSIAERMNIRYRYIVFTPQLLPSRSHPFPAIKTQTLPGWCNLISWKIAGFLDRFNITLLLNRHRKRMGLGPVKNGWDHILGDDPIAACDREIASIPADVGRNVVQTGYLHLDQPEVLMPELDRFLNRGGKPIYAGFGSMPPRDQNRNIPIFIKAARNAGRRIIIAKPWGKTVGPARDNDIFFIKNYPHLALFPKTCAAIHHGGAGTTAACAAAGIPQVTVPHILDQYYNGNRIYQAGIGQKPIWRSRLTAARLTAELQECISSSKTRSLAERVAQSIDIERSIKRTVKEIERGTKS